MAIGSAIHSFTDWLFIVFNAIVVVVVIVIKIQKKKKNNKNAKIFRKTNWLQQEHVKEIFLCCSSPFNEIVNELCCPYMPSNMCSKFEVTIMFVSNVAAAVLTNAV